MSRGARLRSLGFFAFDPVIVDDDGYERRALWRRRLAPEVWGDDRTRAVVRVVRMRLAIEADHSGARRTVRRAVLVIFALFFVGIALVVAGAFLLLLPILLIAPLAVFAARRLGVRTAKRETKVDWIAPMCLGVGVCPVCFSALPLGTRGDARVVCGVCRASWAAERVVEPFLDPVPGRRGAIENERIAYPLLRKRGFLSEDALGGRCLIGAVLPGDRATLGAELRARGTRALARTSRVRRQAQVGVFVATVAALVGLTVYGPPGVAGGFGTGLIGTVIASAVPLYFVVTSVRGASAGAMRVALLREGLCACCSDALVDVDEVGDGGRRGWRTARRAAARGTYGSCSRWCSGCLRPSRGASCRWDGA